MASTGENAAWIRTNRGVAACLVVLFGLLIVYLLNQDWVYAQQRDGFTLGFFSVAGAGAMFLCAVWMLFDRLSGASTPELLTITLRQIGRCVLALALLGIYFILAWNDHFAQDWLRPALDAVPLTGEFVLWTAIFMAFGMYGLGVRPARSAIVAGVVVSFVIFGLFRLIGIALPSNFLLS